MVKREKIIEKLLFISLVIFPFGQISKLFLGFQFFDIINLALIFALLINYKFEFLKFKYFYSFLFIVSFSLFVSQNINSTALLYLGRLSMYILLPVYLTKFLYKNRKYRQILLNALLIVSIFTAIFGLIQYFWIPDLRSLKLLGWDDHYYRLTGTFLDPAFTGIIFVLGILLAIFLKKKIPLLILIPALILTYSRASYLALLFGIIPILATNYLFIFLGSGEGVNLMRTNSIFAKLVNYKESFNIISDHPLFGVGYNNICAYQKFSVNACFGLDNSLLFIWATTGFLGIASFIALIFDIYKNVDYKYKNLLLSSGLAVLVHAQFTNTLFYAWILYWFGILIAVTRKG